MQLLAIPCQACLLVSSFSIQKYFYDKMDFRLFYFHVTISADIKTHVKQQIKELATTSYYFSHKHVKT